MIRNGSFVAANLSAIGQGSIDAENIQPNGVDLTVDEVWRIHGKAKFRKGNYRKPDRTRMELDDGFADNFVLYPGQYAVVYGEEVSIPDGHVGLVLPRSRVMRSGMHLTSALWDQGYEGRGEGLLRIPQSIDYIKVEKGSSLAQMVYIEAEDGEETYDGSHQGERL